MNSKVIITLFSSVYEKKHEEHQVNEITSKTVILLLMAKL